MYARLFPAHAPLGPELPADRPARASAAPYTDDELHEALFGDVEFRPTHSAGVGAAAPGHVQFTGMHIHEHTDWQGGRTPMRTPTRVTRPTLRQTSILTEGGSGRESHRVGWVSRSADLESKVREWFPFRGRSDRTCASAA